MLGMASGDSAACLPNRGPKVLACENHSAAIKIGAGDLLKVPRPIFPRGLKMRKAFLIAGCLSISIAASAGKPNVADFPLRVHIFGLNGTAHYYARSLDSVDGEGRANLYENGEPRGFDFSYDCADRLRVSPGFEVT